MRDTEQWVDWGAISFEQAERLGVEPPPERLGGPRTVEVVAYIGAIAIFIATIAAVIKVAFSDDPIFGFFLGDFDNVPGGLVALAGAAITFGTGYRFAAGRGAVRRASGFFMLAGYLLASFGFGLLLFDLDLGDFTPTVVLIPSAIVALAGFNRLQSVPTQLALFSVAISAVSAILILIQVEEILDPAAMAVTAALGGPLEFGSWISQTVNVALGLAWIWLGHTGVFRPRNAAFFIGSLYAFVFGLILFSSADGWLVLSGALALAFLWGAMQWRSSVLGAVGALAAIVAILQGMSLVYDEPGTTEFILWFGIPGLLSLAVIWGLNLDGSSSAPAPPVAELPPQAG